MVAKGLGPRKGGEAGRQGYRSLIAGARLQAEMLHPWPLLGPSFSIFTGMCFAGVEVVGLRGL